MYTYSVNSLTDTAAACGMAGEALDNYRQAVLESASENLLVKYVDAMNFRYSTLECGKDKASEANKECFAAVDKYCADNAAATVTAAINYCYLILWGRFAEMANPLEAINSGVADKIKAYGEKLYGFDKTYGKHTAGLILGRMHYKAPNIPFIIPWPDKDKARAYLEECVKLSPKNLTAAFFLADALWDAGDEGRKRAIKLFDEVSSAKPDKNYYFNDLSTIRQCKDRMKELGLN